MAKGKRTTGNTTIYKNYK